MQAKGTLTITAENEEELAAFVAFLQGRRKQVPSKAGNGDAGESPPRQPSSECLLDLETEKHESLMEWLRITKVLSTELPLRIDQKGIHSRLSDGSSRQVVFDSRIGKQLFSLYHLKAPGIDVTLQDAGTLLQTIERIKRKKQSLRLCIASSEEGILRAGENHSIKLARCTVLKEKIEPPESDVGAALSMGASSHFWITRTELIALLMDAKANAPYVDMIAVTNDLTLESHTESGDYSKTITQSYQCKSPSRSRLYYVDLLLRCLKASRCEKITINNFGTFLQVWFSGDVHARMILILACKTIAEKAESIQKGVD